MLPEVEDLLQRGIACGALVDPWNILGFQGQYPRFHGAGGQRPRPPHRRSDPRRRRDLQPLRPPAQRRGGPGQVLARRRPRPRAMRQLADWWDRFATTTVSDVPHVHGGRGGRSRPSTSPRRWPSWRERGAAAADLAFWRSTSTAFTRPRRSPSSSRRCCTSRTSAPPWPCS